MSNLCFSDIKEVSNTYSFANRLFCEKLEIVARKNLLPETSENGAGLLYAALNFLSHRCIVRYCITLTKHKLLCLSRKYP